MVRGKTSTPISAGLRIRKSSPSSVSKTKVKPELLKTKKSSSRSPSPATAVLIQKPGQSESLQREKSKRLRSHEPQNGLKEVVVVKNDRSVNAVKKSTAPAKVSIQSAKKCATLDTPTTTEKIEKKAATNGKLSKMSKGTSDAPVAKKHKVVLDFEEDEEESENEEFKKAVEDIEKNLGRCEERSSKGRKSSSDSTDAGKDEGKKKRAKSKLSLNKQKDGSAKNGQVEKVVVLQKESKSTKNSVEEESTAVVATVEEISKDNDSIELIENVDEGRSKEVDDDNKMKSKQPVTEKPSDNLISTSEWEDISDDDMDVTSAPKTSIDETSTVVEELIKKTVTNKEHPVDGKENISKGDEEGSKDDGPSLEEECSKEKVDNNECKKRKTTRDDSNEPSSDKRKVDEEEEREDPKVIEDNSNVKTDDGDEVVMMDEGGVEPILKRKLLDSSCDDPSDSSCSTAEKKLKLDDGQNGPHVTHNMHGFMRRLFGLKRQSHFLATEQNKSVVVNTVSEDDKENVSADTEKDVEISTVDEKESEDKRPEKKEKDKTYQLSKAELEMLVLSKVTEYFTDGNKSEIGALRRRCEQLEKALEQWRRKANTCQKQVTDLQIVIQRAQLNKKLYMKTPMRSVGLQVQLTKYIPVGSEPSKVGAPRVATVAKINPKTTTTTNTAVVSKSATTTTGQRVIIPQQLQANSLAFVTNLGSSTAVSGTYVASKPTGVSSNMGNVLASRTMISGMPLNNRPGITAKSPSNQFGISLLHPRSVCPTSQTLVFSSPIVTNAAVTMARTAALTSPMAVTSIHPALEPNKIVAASSAVNPIPMRLVPNQASRSTTAGNTNTTLTPVKNTLVGQPAVKYIDLAADDEEQFRTAPSFAVSNVTNALTVVPSLTGTNTVTVLTPSSSSGQLITLNSSSQSAFSTAASLRMAPPARTNGPVTTASINTTPMRVAYLMPSTSVVTMVRPNQSMIVGQSPIQRQVQPGGILRPNVPTIVLQRGTTLVPIQQSQVTPLRPGTIVSNIRPVAPTSTVRSVTAAMTSSQVSPLFIAPKVPPSIPPLNTTSLMQKTVMSTTTGKPISHPAPLPAQPTYPELPSANRKALPSKPALKISKAPNGIVLSWNMTVSTSLHAEISTYQLYAYQEGSAPPSTALWKKVGDVKALPLPMACTLTQFVEGHKYYFAVRAVDVHKRIGPFSDPGSIALVQPNSVKNTKT